MAIKHTIRTGKDLAGQDTKEVSLTTRTAIIAFCRECMGFSPKEVELCTSPLCPLFPFRSIHHKTGSGRKGNAAGLVAWRADQESK